MLFRWDEVLPLAILELDPVHRQIVGYVANLTGKRLTGNGHALLEWG